MATGPMTEAVDGGDTLRGSAEPATQVDYDDRADLLRRCEDNERVVQRLTAELADARAQIEALQAASNTGGGLSLFEGNDADKVRGDGSDPQLLSVALGATALVAGMVTVLALINGTLMSPFGLLMLALTVCLGWAAMRTKVEPIEVSVVRGLVYVKKGDSTHRFDVRNASTQVTQTGTPGQPGWKLEFARRGMDPFVIDASMVEPVDFMAQLRQWRSEI